MERRAFSFLLRLALLPLSLLAVDASSETWTTATFPAAFSCTAPRSTDIRITFNRAIVAESVRDTTFRVFGSQSGFHEGSVSFDSASRTAAFTPSTEFRAGERVFVTVRRTIVSALGDTIPSPVSWEFTARSDKASGVFIPAASFSQSVSATARIATDVNGDGRTDIVLTTVDNLVVWSSLANGSFSRTTNMPVAGSPLSVASGDLDADGDVDIVVGNRTAGIATFVNDGTGAFTADRTLPLVGAQSLAIADLDGDGNLDLGATVRNSSVTHVFRGTGNGFFLEAGTVSNLAINLHVLFADVTRDGLLDIVQISSSYMSVSTNTGGLTFTTTNSGFFNLTATEVFPADLDKNGRVDFLAYQDNYYEVQTERGSTYGFFEGPYSFNPGMYITGAATIDVTGDGNVDLVVAGSQDGAPHIAELKNVGNLQFQKQTAIPLADSRGPLLAGDFNGDGRTDVLIGRNTGDLQVLLNGEPYPILTHHPEELAFGTIILDSSRVLGLTIVNRGTSALNLTGLTTGDPAFTVDVPRSTIAEGDSVILSVSFRPTEFREHRDSLIIQSNDPASPRIAVPLGGTASIVREMRPRPWSEGSAEGLTISLVFARTMITDGGLDTSVAVIGSMTGRHDIAIEWRSAANELAITPAGRFQPDERVQVTVRGGLRTADGNTIPPVRWEFFAAPSSGSGLFVYSESTPLGEDFAGGLRSVDIDRDGDVDIAGFSAYNGQWLVYANNGDLTFTRRPGPTIGYGVQDFRLGDVDGDGRIDVVAVNSSQQMFVLLQQPDGTMTAGSPIALGAYSYGMAMGDIDLDGRADLALRLSWPVAGVRFWRSAGAGVFVLSDSLIMINGPSAIDLADLDGDGDLDLVATAGSEVIVYERTRDLHYLPRGVAASIPYGGSRLECRDLDGDGDADIMTASNALALIRNDGGFSFVVLPGASTYMPIYHWAVGDFDGDGDPDLVTNSGERWYTYHENKGALTFTRTTRPLSSNSSYYEMAPGDFDGDGDIDIVFRAPYGSPCLVGVNRDREATLAVSVRQLDLHLERIGQSKADTLLIFNHGAVDDLVIDTVRTSHAAFTVVPASGRLGPGDTLRLVVRFQPVEPRLYEDSLVIVSNSRNHPETWVRLNGEGDQIQSIEPTPYRADLADTAAISVTWAVALDPASVNNTTVLVTGLSSGRRLPVNVTYEAGSRTTVVRPETPFPKSEQINLSFTTGLRGESGTPSVRARQWDYTVRAESSAALFRPRKTISIPTDPVALAPGDFDADGDLDLVVTANGASRLVVLRNDSAWSFTPTTLPTELSGGEQVMTGDYDGDGRVDIVVTGLSSKLQFFQNDGGFHFTLKEVATPGYLGFLTQGDFDGDGDIDLAAASTASDGSWNILRNDGAWTFTVTSENRPTYIRGLSSGDYDNDGDVDISIGLGLGSILRNDGGWRFAETTEPWGISPRNEADLDGDGDLEILSGGYPGSVSIFKNLGDLRFEMIDVWYESTVEFIPADVNGDGRIDLVMTTNAGTKISLNEGGLVFRQRTFVEDVTTAWGSSVFDIDGDGDRDLATISIGSDELRLFENQPEVSRIVLSRMSHDFGSVPRDSVVTARFRVRNTGSRTLRIDSMRVSDPAFTVPSGPFNVGAFDSTLVDVSFRPSAIRAYADSIMIASNDPEQPVIYFSLRGRTAQRIASLEFPAPWEFSGPPDSVVLRLTQGAVPATLDTVRLIIHGSVSGRHARTFTYDPASRVISILPTGRFVVGERVTVSLGNNFRFEDATPVLSTFEASFVVRATEGTASFSTTTMFYEPQPTVACVADFDANGTGDIAFLGTDAMSRTAIYLVRAVGTLFYDRVGSVSVPWPGLDIKAGDMDGDGRPDLVVPTTQDVSIYRATSDFGFSRTSVGTLPDVTGCVVSDIDGDGAVDVALASFTLRTVRILFNSGAMSFTPVDIPFNSAEPKQLEAADMDGDGDMDLVLGKTAGPNFVLLINEGGRSFRLVVLPSVTSYARTFWCTDFDADGLPDLAVGHSSINSLLLLRNRGDLTFETVSQPSVTKDPLFIVGGDLDADGDCDLVISNNGYYPTQSVYRYWSGQFGMTEEYNVGAGSYPMVSGDTDGDGSVDVVYIDQTSRALVILQNIRFLPYFISYDSLDFGPVAMGSSKTRRVDIMSAGSGQLTIDSMSTGMQEFQVAANKMVLTPGDTSHVTVTFTPTTVGWVGTMLSIYIHGESPIFLNITGVGGPAVSVADPEGVPSEFELRQNFPNPFNPSTEIRFGVPQASRVRLSVYDLRGREVMPPLERDCEPGWFTFTFRGDQLVSGVYLCRMSAISAGPGPVRTFVKTQKMVLVR